MTEFELEELISDCPILYHMAEAGSLDAILENGLLSTTALLDLYEVDEHSRNQIERMHRPSSVSISGNGLPVAVIRDQKPMSDDGLRRCLPDHVTPTDWYRKLNSKVFFWLTENRLHRLTGARAYRSKEHDVIEVDTRALIEQYRDEIWLCPINSGCTKPFSHPRNENTFLRIDDYPYSHWRSKRARGERVVELAVDYSVPNISKYVLRAIRMRGVETVALLAL